jgi:CheY-like chemotaxis protein
VKVAVNISGVQWRQTDLVDAIDAALKEAGLQPSCLELELTETVVMQNAAEAIQMLDRLNAMGVRLSIDDFGTGYSSLAYLKRLPLDSLKIDRAFVNDLVADPDDALITMAMINMAHNLKLSVVAEGVETEAQLQFLRSHGCDIIQGFYFAKPLDARECEHFMRALPKMRAPSDSPSSPALLLLDDSNTELDLLARVWEQEGFRILKASTTQTAYSLLASDPAILAAIADYHLREHEDGVAFLSNVRRLYPKIIRILSTLGEDLSMLPSAVNQAGVQKFLSKRWDAERLRAELRDATLSAAVPAVLGQYRSVAGTVVRA